MERNKTADTLAERIGRLRTEAGESQQDLADEIGVKRETVKFWESGDRQIKGSDIVKLAKHFDVSADYLLGLVDVPTNDKDLQFVCSYTGLSERTVGLLEFAKEIPGHSGVLDSLLSESALWMSKNLCEIQTYTDELISKTAGGFKKEAADVVADAATRLELALFRFSKCCGALPEDLYGASSALEKADEYADLAILNDPEKLSLEIDAPLETARSILADRPITSIADFRQRINELRRQYGQHTEG